MSAKVSKKKHICQVLLKREIRYKGFSPKSSKYQEINQIITGEEKQWDDKNVHFILNGLYTSMRKEILLFRL